MGAHCAISHENSGMTLKLLMFGRATWLPIEVILGSGDTSTREAVTSCHKYIDGLRDQM